MTSHSSYKIQTTVITPWTARVEPVSSTAVRHLDPSAFSLSAAS